MERNWNRLRSLSERSGSFFRVTVETEPQKEATQAQHKLFKRICKMVEEDTGQDFQSVYKEFLKLTPMKTVQTLFGELAERNMKFDEMTAREVQIFLEQVLVHANEIMGCNYVLYYDDKLGTLLTREK